MQFRYTYLALSWSVSRGRDTYGYNIARLDDRETDVRYRCMGGGYDMTGTVFGDYLTERHQLALAALASEGVEYVGTHKKHPTLYGLFFRADGSAYCDGACGLESMLRIAQFIGLAVRRTHNKRGHTTGFHVENSFTV
jgi:hypothetical protein